ncbi:MAG: hypothetical protein H6678_04130 [Candidatus Delongbacteria bacterium]|nr:hypothetical protein [Candidatus Cloacimonadota bacterium]MCB9472979.1 hypothetical protein [Candidatus Delongbacteria bacterium]
MIHACGQCTGNDGTRACPVAREEHILGVQAARGKGRVSARQSQRTTSGRMVAQELAVLQGQRAAAREERTAGLAGAAVLNGHGFQCEAGVQRSNRPTNLPVAGSRQQQILQHHSLVGRIQPEHAASPAALQACHAALAAQGHAIGQAQLGHTMSTRGQQQGVARLCGLHDACQLPAAAHRNPHGRRTGWLGGEPQQGNDPDLGEHPRD